MPASSTSAMGSPSCSRWRATTTRATSSPIRARRPASAASCATSSPWARGRSPASMRLRFGDPEHPKTRHLVVRRGRRHRRLRQFVRRADGRRPGPLPHPLQRQQPGQRHGGRPRRDRQDFLRGGLRRRHADRLSRLQNRPRRHPRRQHGVGGIRRGRRGEAPDRAGRRSVLGKASARSLPGDHGQGLRDRHPGHGRRRPDLLGGRDGRQGRSRRRSRARQGAVPRDRHERLRDDALGKPGAHADGAQAREGEPRPRRSSANGASTSPSSATPRRASASSSSTAAT